MDSDRALSSVAGSAVVPGCGQVLALVLWIGWDEFPLLRISVVASQASEGQEPVATDPVVDGATLV